MQKAMIKDEKPYPSFLESFHPEKRQKKLTVAVCRIMAVTYLYPQFDGSRECRILPNGESGIGREREVIAHSKPQESVVKHCGCIKFKGECQG